MRKASLIQIVLVLASAGFTAILEMQASLTCLVGALVIFALNPADAEGGEK